MMNISEIYGGFRIQFDAKLSITITKEEAKYILTYLKTKQEAGALEDFIAKKNPDVFKFFDCGEY